MTNKLHAIFEQLKEQSRAKGCMPLQDSHGVKLPESYLSFMRILGPGSWGGFLHFEAVQYLSTHAELLSTFMDDDLKEMLEPTADVLVFANSDNGDMCGWHLHDLARMPADDCPVIRIAPRSFDEELIAKTTADFFEKLGQGADLFGVGGLPLRFQSRPVE